MGNPVIDIRIFNSCVMTVNSRFTTILFPDGACNVMCRDNLDRPEYRDVVRWTGYGEDWRQYNIDHDLTHIFVAEVLDLPYSPSLHHPFDGPLCDAPQEIKDDEHVTGRLHRYMKTGEPDDYGVLEATFGDQLDVIADMLREWLS
jgi:hypothetical protein